MKFIISREFFLPALQNIVNVIEKRQTMPILANVLIATDENSLTLTGTDLEIQLVVRLEAQILDPGSLTIPARKLLDLCRYLPSNAEITLEQHENKLKVVAAKSRFMLSSLPSSSYPEFSEAGMEKSFTLPAKILRQALVKTLFCMANQDVRHYLNGLLIHISNATFKLVASDGHRLAIFECALENPTDLEERMILPRKAAMELARLLPNMDQDITLFFSNSNIKAQFDHLTFSAKLVDAKYPDFSKVFQQPFFPAILLPKQEVKESLTRAAVLASEKFKGVTLEFEKHQLVISSQNTDHDEAEEQIALVYTGDPLTISFNAQYLLDAVSNIEAESVVFTISTNASCCFIEEPDPAEYRFIVMPMRL